MAGVRRKKLILKGVQLRSIGYVLAGVMITLTTSMLLNLWFLVRHEDAASGSLETSVATDVAILAAATALAAMIPVILILGRSITFQVAGPVYKFRQFLQGVLDGKPEACHLRDGDHFQDVCELLNAVTEPVRRRSGEAQAPLSPVEPEADHESTEAPV